MVKLAFILSWTIVDDSLRSADVKVTIQEIGNWVIPAVREGAAYHSLQWYIDQSYDRTRRNVIGKKLLERNPKVTLAILKEVARRLRETTDHPTH